MKSKINSIIYIMTCLFLPVFFGCAAIAEDGLKKSASCTLEDSSSCDKESFCLIENGKCMEAGVKGVCTAKSRMCTKIYMPVCGCDNKTYSNECVAHSAGVSVKSNGVCE